MHHIKNKNQLIEYFAQGGKSVEDFKIGTEHERFLFSRKTRTRLNYESIKNLFQYFIDQGWQPVAEKGHIIAVQNLESACSLTLEPGGQFELSGAPLGNLHQASNELATFNQTLRNYLASQDIDDLLMGFDPITYREQVPWMPKQRYDIMRTYMPTRGGLGLDMMLRTCTVQVNLDYAHEQDMVMKMRVAMALQPFVAALFATSPFKDRKESGYQSFRNVVWQDTDPDRCGLLPFVFQDDMGYERYVEYLLNIPMYFVYRKESYIPAAGYSFRDFINGELPSYPKEIPTMADWRDHTSVAFPEVRLKRYLELRGADSGPLPLLQALPALWVGLLYDQENLETLHDQVMKWPIPDLEQAYLDLPKRGFEMKFLNLPVLGYLESWLNLAQQGLKRRYMMMAQGKSEEVYLRPLETLIRHQQTVATYLCDTFHQYDHSFEFVWSQSFWEELDQWLMNA
jgi:glutamate--cysteine ligase